MELNSSAVKGAVIRERMMEVKAEGNPIGRIPIGYKLSWNQEKGKFVDVDPMYGPLVKEAFRLMATGRYSLTQAVYHLADKGWARTDGTPISTVSLHGILHNRIYLSGFTGAPPLTNAEDFFGVQGVLRARRK